MSLRAFHLFFIGVAASFAVFLAAWSIVRMQGGANTLGLALLSGIAAIGLAAYGFRFFRKTRGLSTLVLLLWVSFPRIASACAVCFNPENEEARKGLNFAIGFLLIVTALVLTGLTAMVLKLVRQHSGES